VHLVLAGSASVARLRQLASLKAEGEITIVVRLDGSDTLPFCWTKDSDVVATFALYRGSDEIDGTEFLIDASGRLRSIWFPGRRPDWSEPAILAGQIAAIRRTPAQPLRSSGASAHVHSH
jgi:hypothetical protein